MKIYENMSFDEERALYGSDGVCVRNCRFDGERDGESAFKESRDVIAENSYFNLRYPFWHDDGVTVDCCELTPLCRAALWYSTDIKVKNSKLHGIKALRECADIEISNCDISSLEFGWFSKDIKIRDTHAEGEYFMLRSERLDFEGVSL